MLRSIEYSAKISFMNKTTIFDLYTLDIQVFNSGKMTEKQIFYTKY